MLIRETPWRSVFFDGPQSDRAGEGDEIPSWCVYVGKVYRFHDDAGTNTLARRLMRGHERKQKQPDQVAVCGINFYTLSPRERNRGCYWTHCRQCGKALRYFGICEQAQANNGEGKRQRASPLDSMRCRYSSGRAGAITVARQPERNARPSSPRAPAMLWP